MVVKSMGKLIAIWGAPNAGKTTVAVKLATALHDHYGQRVYTVFADDTAPVLPVLFPMKKADDMYSIGAALSQADMTRDTIIANSVTLKDKKNMAFLGYKDSENQFSYARSDDGKYRELLSFLRSLADVVIVDCTSVPNQLSRIAMSEADTIFRIASVNLKSISFFSSQLPIMSDGSFQCLNHTIVVNVTENDVYAPIDDAIHHFGDTPYTLPYCQEIRFQSINGELINHIGDKKYAAQLNALASAAMG